jgi:hypothetical protein
MILPVGAGFRKPAQHPERSTSPLSIPSILFIPVNRRARLTDQGQYRATWFLLEGSVYALNSGNWSDALTREIIYVRQMASS